MKGSQQRGVTWPSIRVAFMREKEAKCQKMEMEKASQVKQDDGVSDITFVQLAHGHDCLRCYPMMNQRERDYSLSPSISAQNHAEG